MHEEVNNHRYHIRNLFKFYLESHQHRAKLDSNVPAVDESTTMPHSRQAVLEKIKSYQVADPWKRLPLPMHQLQYCAWGDTFAKAMLVWMDAVKWPKMEALVDQQDIGISWAELAISFMLHSNLYFPVKRKDNQGTERLFHAVKPGRSPGKPHQIIRGCPFVCHFFQADRGTNSGRHLA